MAGAEARGAGCVVMVSLGRLVARVQARLRQHSSRGDTMVTRVTRVLRSAEQ